MGEYLPSMTSYRIAVLREEAKLTIEELAEKIGINATTLGRMEKEQTKKISSHVLTALAREFNVSTDFLLGLTNIPDRKNYDIEELGLSAQAARNLYTRKVNTDVIYRLLENARFGVLTAIIAQYLDDTFAAGVAAHNQLLSCMSDMLLGLGQQNPEQAGTAREAARAVNLSKVPPRQTEQVKIQNTFMTILRELKQEAGSDLEPSKAATKEIIDKIMVELRKGQDALPRTITPEQITDTILNTVDGAALDPEKVAKFRVGLLALFESLPNANYTHDE